MTHPNVCRVFDIGEVDGEQFISMEFVDGEDLASLLRQKSVDCQRDKAIEIARQLCAGIAAAHDKGVLHRDLKPANIMLDGRGDVRITDFGISGRVENSGDDTAAGTPAYMAHRSNSQRGEATIRNDIYSLGLVLYEVFTRPTGVHQARRCRNMPGMHRADVADASFDIHRRHGSAGRAGDSEMPGKRSCQTAVERAGGRSGVAGRRSAGGDACRR